MRYEIKWPLGRLMEMLPYACGGVLLAKSQILKKYQNHILFLFFIILLLLFMRNHPFSSPQGFGYQGINLFINTILIFSLFYLGNLEKLSSQIKRIILNSSEYSLGIYCIHYIILNITRESDITLFPTSSFTRGVIIYLISLYISFIISKIPSKFALNLVK